MTQFTRTPRWTEDEPVSTRVIAAVADACDVDPLELPPLGDVLDPDALDQLFNSFDSRIGPGRVDFMMAGCEVVVHSDGEVVVTPPGEQSSAALLGTPAVEQDEAESVVE